MKLFFRHTILHFLIVLSIALVVPATVSSQPPPDDPVEGENTVGGSIGGGLLILLALGAGYGLVKIKQREV